MRSWPQTVSYLNDFAVEMMSCNTAGSLCDAVTIAREVRPAGDSGRMVRSVRAARAREGAELDAPFQTKVSQL